MRTAIARLRRVARFVVEFTSDLRRYYRASAPAEVSHESDPRHIECQLTKDYHAVEKGFAMPAVRRPFGEATRERIDSLAGAPSAPTSAARYAREAASALAHWNSGGGAAAADSLLRALPAPRADTDAADTFIASRASVRVFDETRPVARELIDGAVGVARSAPSVCNRQAWHVHAATSPQSRAALLATQSGNSGFGQTAPVVLAITVDLALFQGVGERNQAWIDGGIFAMTLALALHGRGLGTCMLNMANRTRQADAARAVLGVSSAHVVIMLMAVGYPAAGARVARSPRRDVSEVIRYISSDD